MKPYIIYVVRKYDRHESQTNLSTIYLFKQNAYDPQLSKTEQLINLFPSLPASLSLLSSYSMSMKREKSQNRMI